MNTVLERNQSVVLQNISWKSYETIADTLHKETAAHFTYDRGQLEIMVLSLKHENLKKILAMIFEKLAIALKVDIMPCGSTTFRREDLERGFEPDECYYVGNAALMRGRSEVNLEFDPAPDLTIEIDISSSSLNRFGIFAAIGIHEVWRYDGNNLTIYLIENGDYTLSKTSHILSSVESSRISELARIGQKSRLDEFLRQIENYSAEIIK